MQLLAACKLQSSVGKIAAVRRVSKREDGSALTWTVVSASPHLEYVPHSVWYYFEGIDADGQSRWIDDPNDPEGAATIDWLAAHLSIIDWFVEENLDYGQLEYLHLCLEVNFAEAIARGGSLEDANESVDASVNHFTDIERENWIKSRGRTPGGADQAYREFRSHPKYDGTIQSEFRKQCTRIWGQNVGRPKMREKKA